MAAAGNASDSQTFDSAKRLRPGMKTIEENFWNTEHVVKEFVEYPTDQYWQEILKKYKDGRENLLDLGCGGGRNTESALEVGYKVQACDYSSSMVQATLKRFSGKHKKNLIDVVQANMTDLPYNDSTFDVVIANGVFHNAYTPEKFIAAVSESSRVIKDAGIILLNVFINNDLDRKTIKPKKIKNLYVTNDNLRMVLYSSKEIIKLLSKAGFEPVEPIQIYQRSLFTGKRTVLKTVLIKTKKTVLPSFPNNPIETKKLTNYLKTKYQEIPNWNIDSKVQRLGFAMTEPLPIAVKTFARSLARSRKFRGK